MSSPTTNPLGSGTHGDARETVAGARKHLADFGRRHESDEELKRRLLQGTLTDGDAPAENQGTDRPPKDLKGGGASFAVTAVDSQRQTSEQPDPRFTGRSVAATVGGGGLTEQSKQFIEGYQRRATECFEALRSSLTFVKKHDDYNVVKGIENLSLEGFLADARIRQREPVKQFSSQITKYERLELFESDLERLDTADLLQPDIEMEEEVKQMGLKFGLLTEDGSWKPKCDCESKFRAMQGKARADGLRIAKAKYVTAFVKEVDRNVAFVNAYLEASLEEEEQRRKEVAEVRERQITLLNRLQNQQKQIERLRRKAKEAGASVESEHSHETEEELMHMKEYVALLESGKTKGKAAVNAQKDIKEIRRRHMRTMRKLHMSSASHERSLMASHDVDGFVDQGMQAYLELHNRKRKVVAQSMQTLSEEDLFVEHGIVPDSKRAGGSSTLLGEISTAVPPVMKTDTTQWPADSGDLEDSVGQLLGFVTATLTQLDEGRTRVMTAVGKALPSGCSDLEAELGPLFGHTNGVARDHCNHLASDVKVGLRKISTFTQRLIDSAHSKGIEEGIWKAKAGDEESTGEADGFSRNASFSQYVERIEHLQEENTKLMQEVNQAKIAEMRKNASKPAAAASPKGGKKAGGAATKKAEPTAAEKKGSMKKPKAAKAVPKDSPAASPIQLQLESTMSTHGGFNLTPTSAAGGPDSTALQQSLLVTESQVKSLRDALALASRSLLRNDLVAVRPDLIGSLEMAATTDTITGVAMQICELIRSVADGSVESAAPHLLIETGRTVRKAVEFACKSALGVGLTFPAFIIPELDSSQSFSEDMKTGDLATLLMKTESHLNCLTNCITKQVPGLVSSIVQSHHEATVKVVEQTKTFCTDIQEMFPDLYIDEPVRKMQLVSSEMPRRTVLPDGDVLAEGDSGDGRLMQYPDDAPWLHLVVEAVDNLTYFLKEHHSSTLRDREAEAKTKAEEMAAEMYNRLVSKGDKAVLRETNRAAKMKKEVEDRIRSEKERFEQFADEENKRLQELQALNAARAADQESHSKDLLALREEMIRIQTRRAEKAVEHADAVVEREGARAEAAIQSAETSIAEEEQRLMETQVRLFEGMLARAEESELSEREAFEKMEQSARVSTEQLFHSVKSALEETEAAMQHEIDSIAEESLTESYRHPMLGTATPDRFSPLAPPSDGATPDPTALDGDVGAAVPSLARIGTGTGSANTGSAPVSPASWVGERHLSARGPTGSDLNSFAAAAATHHPKATASGFFQREGGNGVTMQTDSVVLLEALQCRDTCVQAHVVRRLVATPRDMTPRDVVLMTPVLSHPSAIAASFESTMPPDAGPGVQEGLLAVQSDSSGDFSPTTTSTPAAAATPTSTSTAPATATAVAAAGASGGGGGYDGGGGAPATTSAADPIPVAPTVTPTQSPPRAHPVVLQAPKSVVPPIRATGKAVDDGTAVRAVAAPKPVATQQAPPVPQVSVALSPRRVEMTTTSSQTRAPTPPPELRAVGLQTMDLEVPLPTLTEEAIGAASFMSVDCCVGSLAPIPVFISQETNTQSQMAVTTERAVNVGVTVATRESQTPASLMKSAKADLTSSILSGSTATLESSILSPMISPFAATAYPDGVDALTLSGDSSNGLQTPMETTATENVPEPMVVHRRSTQVLPQPQVPPPAVNRTPPLPTFHPPPSSPSPTPSPAQVSLLTPESVPLETDASTRTTPPPHPQPQRQPSPAALPQQPAVGEAPQEATMESPVVLVSMPSQTLLGQEAMLQLFNRVPLSMQQLDIIASTISDLNEAFAAVVPSASKLMTEISTIGPKMLTAWDTHLNELIMYLRDLAALSRPKAKANQLLGVHRRHVLTQVAPQLRPAAVQTDNVLIIDEAGSDGHTPPAPHLGSELLERLSRIPSPTPQTPLSVVAPSVRDLDGSMSETASVVAPPAGARLNALANQLVNANAAAAAAASKTLALEAASLELDKLSRQLHDSLYIFLPELLKRLRINKHVSDPYPNLFGAARISADKLIFHDEEVIRSISALLTQDSLHAKRRMSATAEHAAVTKRLAQFVEHRKANAFPEDVPQVAAFLDRQERKLRTSLEQFSQLKRQVADEKERALRDFFLPTCDVEVLSHMAPTLHRRKVYAGAARVRTPLERDSSTTTRLQGVAVLDAELPTHHPANKMQLKRKIFLQPLPPQQGVGAALGIDPTSGSPMPKSSTAKVELPPGPSTPPPAPSRTQSLPAMYKVQEGRGERPPLDIVHRESKPVSNLADRLDGGRSHPVARHVVVPQRTTQVRPTRDFFLQPLSGQHATLFGRNSPPKQRHPPPR